MTIGAPTGLATGRAKGRFAVWLAGITAVALVIRVGYVMAVWHDRTILGDPLYYHWTAGLLADGKGFVDPLVLAAGVSRPAALHPPLYSVYLGVFSFLGVRTVTGHMLASCLLGAASVTVGGLAGRRMAGPRVGLLAAGLLAVYPNVWRFDAMVLSETMVIFVVNLTILLAYRYRHRPTMGRLALVGAAVALCTLARAELLLLVPFLVVPLALATRDQPLRQRLGWLAVATVVCGAVMAPWVGYNLRRFDHPVLISDQGQVTLAGANCDATYYGPNVGYWDFDCAVAPARELESQGPNTGGRDERASLHRAVDYARSHLTRVPVVVGARVARILNLWDPPNVVDVNVGYLEANPRSIAWLSLVASWPMLVGAAVGVVVLRRRHIAVFPLLAPCAAVLVTAVVFYASGRFRAAAEGALCLLAAAALD
ncbi:MAG: ArnT family glycosyltransferase, partial [Acidimicrobiales bacterium]